MMKRFTTLLFVLLSLTGAAWGQQYQSQSAPLFLANSKYINGTSAGYAPTVSSGLVLALSSGRVNCANTMTNYAGGTLTLANNTTNYVYLNTAASCVPASNTSGYTGLTVPIATVVTSGGAITSITDDRTLGFATAIAATITGGSCAAGMVTISISNTGVPTCATITSSYVNNTIALTGTDINTANQVTVTHLAAALPVNQGGTGTTSTLTGIVRGGSPLTASEISSDCTTSGSNAITCTQSGGKPIMMAIAHGTNALGTSAISGGACGTATTSTATGAVSTDNLLADFNADPTSTTGYNPATGMLTIVKWVSSGQVNFKQCNNTGSSITPSAVTANWIVARSN